MSKVQDTITTTKRLRDAEDIVASLIALRDELYARGDGPHAEMFFKINSCLYTGYPEAVVKHPRQWTGPGELERTGYLEPGQGVITDEIDLEMD